MEGGGGGGVYVIALYLKDYRHRTYDLFRKLVSS